MVSLLQVEKKLKELVIPIVYPNGTGSPSIVAKDIAIMNGYPVKDSLDKSMAADKIVISISAIEKSDKNTTRYLKRWHRVSIPEATVSMAIDDDYIITITGIAANDLVATIKTTTEIASHQIVNGETMEDIADGLGAQLTGAVVVGNTIYIPGEFKTQFGISVLGIAAREVKRQQKRFCVTIWSRGVEDRDTLGEAIDVYLSDIERFVLQDDFFARIIYNGTIDLDTFQDHRIYKRELEYLIEYATTLADSFTTQVVSDVQIETNRDQ